MGALFSGFVGMTAVVIGRALAMGRPPAEPAASTSASGGGSAENVPTSTRAQETD